MKIKSLKSKILFYLILFATIPLIIGSGTILYTMYKNKEESILNTHYQILTYVEYEADRIIKKIETLGEFVKIKYPIVHHKLTSNLIQLQKNISTILILDNNGILKDFSSNDKINVFKGYDYSNKLFYTNIKNGKDRYWSNIYLSTTNFKPSISYSVRIDKDNIAILIIDLTTLNKFASKFKAIDGSSLVSITDKHGIFLANPQKPEFILQRKDILDLSIWKDYISKGKKYTQIKFIDSNGIEQIGIYGTTKTLHWNIIVKESYSSLFKSFNNLGIFIFCFVLTLILFSIYFSIKLSHYILKPLDTMSLRMEELAHGKSIDDIEKTPYKELNNFISNFLYMQKKIKDREKRVIEEIEKNKQKDIQIFEQSKLASMGEMIGNIAHQWRQPLSVISTSATGILMQKEFGMLSDEKLEKYCNSINDQSQYLSKTIDDFKNYIKGDRIKEQFNISTCIDSFLNLIKPSAANNNIDLIIDIKNDILYNGYSNELVQCFINIFNNSKDALHSNQDIEPKLFILTITNTKDRLNIELKDNAGGIPQDILPKIFEPYFTTKHQSKGTGLGLHMTYNLITDGMDGTIIAVNDTFEYKGESFIGAKFTISLPIE